MTMPAEALLLGPASQCVEAIHRGTDYGDCPGGGIDGREKVSAEAEGSVIERSIEHAVVGIKIHPIEAGAMSCMAAAGNAGAQ